jgi:hypothetical protein
LIKGANTRIRDDNGFLPEDFLKEFDLDVLMMSEYSREIFELL